MEEELANLNIVDEEKVPLQFQRHTKVMEEDYRLCLVGRVLTNSV
ncbi:hypothetical protein Goshw_023544, partial [Gossypium schwendimanii]|nr:hypothetical protein [Gossypium schwendimanii]